jgi:transcription initiation factor TFIIIB Brf1 subunit/transcription initiation factor TFIIB
MSKKAMREKEETQKLISKMNLLPDSAAALNHYTTKICTKIKEKGLMRTATIRKLVTTSAYLACDGKACVATPKLKAAAHSIPVYEIGNARRILKIPRGTAHQKLDSLSRVCHVRDKNVISKAHDYVSLLNNTGSGPTGIAATALSLADNRTLSIYPLHLQEDIIRATGTSKSTLVRLKTNIERMGKELAEGTVDI